MVHQTGLSAFITELRRRRVFRVAAFYGGIAFVIIQIIDGAFSYLHIPEWFGTAIIILLLIGFPIAVVLAWAFDITEEGIVRAKGRPVDAGRKALPFIGNTALVIIAVAAIAFGIWGRWGGAGWNINPGSIRSIAVLPLENQMNDPDQAYFVDGMHEALITALSRLPGVRVIGRTSVLSYRENPKPIPVIAEELNVDAVLEGSVLREGNQVRITTQLVRARPEQHLWSDTFDRELSGILQLHKDVAQAVARQIGLAIGPDKSPEDEGNDLGVHPEAYDLFLKAVAYEDSTEDQNNLNTLTMLEEVVALDPNYTEAWAYLGYISAQVYEYGIDPSPERLVRAKEAIDRAKELAPEDAVTLHGEARLYYYGYKDYFAALERYHAAQRVDRSNLEIIEDIAYTYRRLGRLEESQRSLLELLDIDPRNANVARNLGHSYIHLRQFDEALHYYRMANRLRPDQPEYYRELALLFFQQFDLPDSAWAVMKRGEAKLGPEPFMLARYDILIMEGHLDAAHQLLDSMPESLFAGAVAWPRSMELGFLYEQEGRQAEAEVAFRLGLPALEATAKAYPANSWAQASLGWGYAVLGQKEQALAAGRLAVSLNPVSNDAFFGIRNELSMAYIYLFLGMDDEAIDVVEQWLDKPSHMNIGRLRSEPYWRHLRGNPRFEALIRSPGR